MLPIELIDAILDDIHDLSSLKSLSLVAWPFVAPCQRRLLQTVKLSDSNAMAGLSVLNQSPHILSCIRRIHINLPQRFSRPERITAMEDVLDRLEGVVGCVLDGKSWGFLIWDDIPRRFIMALHRLFARKPTIELHLQNINEVELSTILDLFCRIPLVSFHVVNIITPKVAQDDMLPRGLVLQSLSLRPASHLAVSALSGSVSHFFAKVEHFSCILDNGDHSFRSLSEGIFPILSHAAQTLRTFHLSIFDEQATSHWTVPSVLPTLEYLTLELSHPVFYSAEVHRLFSGMLQPHNSPSLKELRVIFLPVVYDFELVCNPSDLLIELGRMLVSHPKEPRMCWVVPQMFESYEWDVGNALPELRADGRLIFEPLQPTFGHLHSGWPKISWAGEDGSSTYRRRAGGLF
ncbi:hypothetical protein C8F01DRAFT_1151875 [Mycena amicta]|nr:hypothetical protein C8F01DRAFT_1151875 [Mycena amicta]